jgi:cell division protein FtsL
MATGVLYPTMVDAGNWNEKAVQPRGMFVGTPEIYFSKRIDNSRVVKVSDPKRRREMISFAIVLSVFLLFALLYVWQHFSSIEYGYRIEQLTAQRDTLTETNRALRLEESSLKDPGRIDILARQMGMQPPTPGQTQVIDSSFTDSTSPVMAKASGISVISMLQ